MAHNFTHGSHVCVHHRPLAVMSILSARMSVCRRWLRSSATAPPRANSRPRLSAAPPAAGASAPRLEASPPRLWAGLWQRRSSRPSPAGPWEVGGVTGVNYINVVE